MGIGRRDFLRIFGSTLALLAAEPSSAIAILDDLYINRKLGLAFRKPAGWHFADVKQMGEVAKGIQLDMDGPDMESFFDSEEDLPLVGVSQSPLSAEASEFSPGINFYLTHYEGLTWFLNAANHLRPTLSTVGSAEQEIRLLGEILPKFEVLSAPVECSISGCPGTRYSVAFEYRYKNFPSAVRVRQQAISIIQLPAWHRIFMYDSPYLGTDKIYDFSAFIESLKLA